jgi:hypothetical protein
MLLTLDHLTAQLPGTRSLLDDVTLRAKAVLGLLPGTATTRRTVRVDDAEVHTAPVR